MAKEAHIKKAKRFWLEENEEELYKKYLENYKSLTFEDTGTKDKDIYLFYKLLKQVCKETMYDEGQIPTDMKLEEFNPLIYYLNGKIDENKLNTYMYFLARTDEDNYLHISYLDYKFNFTINNIELNFLLRASKYDDIFFNSTYEMLLGKNLSKTELYKAGVLINKYDIDYESIEKYIFNTQIGKAYLRIDEIETIGSYIVSDCIEEILEEIYEIFNLKFTNGNRNEDGVYTSLDEVDKTIVSKYKNPDTTGTFVGKLKFRIWGNNKSLICFFKTNEKEYIKLHAWYREAGVYTPRNENTNFCEVKDNTLWKLTIEKSKTNKLYWARSEKIWDNE